MKAIVLLATLKKQEQSNTEVLSNFFCGKLKEKGIDYEIIKLVEYNIPPGTYNNMGEGDAWPSILEKIIECDLVVFATPIWWGNHSSEMQKVIERLDNIHDEILEGKTSKLDGKMGGIIITGDSDGAQHVIGNISNFFNAIGLILPPYATLSVLGKELEKGARTTRQQLMEKYTREYTKTAETMIDQIILYQSVKG